MQTDPIYELIRPKLKTLPPALTLQIAVGIGFVIAAYLVWETLFRWPTTPLLGMVVVDKAFILTAAMPVLVLIISAILTASHARRMDFTMIQTTPLTPNEIVRGFIRAATHQCLPLIGLLIAIWPVIAIGNVQDLAAKELAYLKLCATDDSCIQNYPKPPFPTMQPQYTFEEQIINTLIFGFLAALMWLFNLSAIRIGVFFGLATRNPFAAPVVPIVVILVFAILFLACLSGQFDVSGMFVVTEFTVFYIVVMGVFGWITSSAAPHLKLFRTIKQVG